MKTLVCQLNNYADEKFICHSEQEKYYDDDSYTLIWHGEIYNKHELLKYVTAFGVEKTTATLEAIIVFLFMKYGVKLFSLLRGKFALVIWDKRNEILYGARDRFGIEPLYYTEDANECYIANCKRHLEQTIQADTMINQEALQHYFTLQYVPEPLTLTDGCFKLNAGHYFMKKITEPLQTFAYFSPHFTPIHRAKEEKVKNIQQTLEQCVRERMSNKAPLGTFLSGGIDSTIITAIAKKINPNIKTFTVGFAERGYSEIDLATKTADVLNVEHEKIIVTPEQFIQTIPAMLHHLADPLADPAAVPLYIGCQKAKEEVDILLSGEGADEMFGGYQIYREHKALKVFKFIPQILQQPMLNLASRLPKGIKGKSFIYRGLTPLKDRYVGNAKIFAEWEKETLLNNYCPKSVSKEWMKRYFEQVDKNHPVEQMQYIDWHTWLPGDILFKANHLSRAVDLNIRLPFVDQKIYNIAKQLKIDEKIAQNTTKAILREAVDGMIPEHVLYEKKRGFPVPLKKWLRDDLYVWANRNISNAKTSTFMNKDYALKLLNEHLQRKHDHSRKLWAIIIFNLWYEIFIEETNLSEEPWQLSVN